MFTLEAWQDEDGNNIDLTCTECGLVLGTWWDCFRPPVISLDVLVRAADAHACGS